MRKLIAIGLSVALICSCNGSRSQSAASGDSVAVTTDTTTVTPATQAADVQNSRGAADPADSITQVVIRRMYPECDGRRFRLTASDPLDFREIKNFALRVESRPIAEVDRLNGLMLKEMLYIQEPYHREYLPISWGFSRYKPSWSEWASDSGTRTLNVRVMSGNDIEVDPFGMDSQYRKLEHFPSLDCTALL